MGNHVCAEKCTYCSLKLHQDQENEVEECKHLAGREGNHDCKMKKIIHVPRYVLYLIDHPIAANLVA